MIGVLDLGANGLYALATQEGLLSVVAVLGSLYPAVTVVLARVVLAERVARVQEVGVVLALARGGDQRRLTPRCCSSSAIVVSASRCSTVAIPIARAGLRLPARSSTNTHRSGGRPSRSAASA